MTFSSDGETSSTRPFSGDPNGDIFADSENLVAQSPITTVRTVGTQSGFLVVLKDVDERTSLSVKRKIGTPPKSHVLLTADEVRKLSRILVDGKEADDAAVPEFRVTTGLNRTESANDAISTLTQRTYETSDFSDLNIERSKRRSSERRAKVAEDESSLDDPTSLISPRRANEKKVIIFAIVGFVSLIVLSVVAMVVFFFNYSSSKPPEVVKEITKHEMSSENVDTFVRAYVANLLDFSPRSYRYSQIQAMSRMKPELMNKYWKETNFPLSKGQLKNLPKNQTVMINKLVQEPTSSVSTDVDLYAELVTPNSKEPAPVHLRLGIALNQDGKLTVVSQKDVSSEDAKKKK